MCEAVAKDFLAKLKLLVPRVEAILNAPNGEWTALGVIDVYHSVYPLSQDTKLISKVIELMVLPVLQQFATENQYEIEVAPEQNYYPDVTFTDSAGCKFALDIKTTYRVRGKSNEVSAMTLGSFTGYFRDRNSKKNILYPYSMYSGHFVLGVIYTRNENFSHVNHPLSLQQVELVPRVIYNLKVFAEYKYKIASDRPGSGNTKNIGSVRRVEQLLTGSGPFANLGEQVFDDYWMHYQTRSMAGGKRPAYTNLQEYLKWKEQAR